MVKWSLTVSIIVCVCLLVGLAYVVHNGKTGKVEDAEPGNTSPLVNQAVLSALPRKSASGANTAHLSAAVVPPTNSWLSGMVLQQTPDAVYPMPLSFLAQNNGFEIGLPSITSTATEIAGEHVPGITVGLQATNFRLTRYDKVSATLTYTNNNQTIGTLTMSEGSPFVFYTATEPGDLTLSGINPADILEQNSHYIRYNSDGHTYAISCPASTLTVSTSAVTVQVSKGDSTTLYALPGTQDILQQYAGNILQSVQVGHDQSGATEQTTFHYATSNGRPTVFAVLPYQTVNGQQIGTYQSIYGPMKLLVGSQFTSNVPAVSPSDKLDLSSLTVSQKDNLISSLSTDVANTSINQPDAYGAGKQLARAANLLAIAEQLQQIDAANKLKQLLSQAFAQRLTANSFYYDPTLKGVVYADPSYGSQDFNDHHFHYGYWLYAGSILGQYDPSFVHTYKNQMDLLAADIANYQNSTQFPLERTYDPYAGHSWAGGLAPFADGNDQESSSEAIHAWNGVSLWGQVTHNEDLKQTGLWMLANESNAAATIWRSVDTSDQALKGYTSPVVGIIFGGKRVYSTWFSGDPSAMLGIQLIPMDPSMVSFSSDKNITNSISATIQNDNFNVSLGDYILMYLSLTNPQKAASLAQSQTNIDSGDSKTYLDAFIYSQLDK